MPSKSSLPTSDTVESHALDPSELGYLLTDLVLCSLPMRDPGQVPTWTRKNGPLTLTLGAGFYRDSTGAQVWQVPFGKTARALLLWICTEAKRTGESRLELGDSLNAFLADLGLATGGKDHRHALRMLQVVATMRLDYEVDHRASDGSGMIRGSSRLVTEDWQIYFGAAEPANQRGLLGSWFELSGAFFRALQDHAMPVNTSAWAWLNSASKSPMPLDIYVWLAYRLPHVPARGTTIPWPSVLAQFGSGNVSNPRKARADFVRALELVLRVYPKAVGAVEVTTDGLRLKRAPAPVKGRAKPKGDLPRDESG